ncbi:MAG: class I SAM-dependent methyltransferase [Azoarcus sp.]|jgi:SAM-dependent methyltransferase|nr:class I SAM-dependent methyltransferase [Azoarcus sp.]
MPSTPPELEFSCKYDLRHAENYFRKHRDGLFRRLSHWRETRMARKALRLAGNPVWVLDLPCGAGRFWPMLCEYSGRVLLAADNSPDMLKVALKEQPHTLTRRIEIFQTSAFAVDLEDNTVDCVFCMRLLHHIGDAEHRMTMLREFHRVTRDTLVVSLWVDGNYKAWKHQRLEKRRFQESAAANRSRFVIDRTTIESEFRQAGFDVIGYADFLPGYAMWRAYALRKVNVA